MSILFRLMSTLASRGRLWIVPGLTAAAVVSFAAGSGSVKSIKDLGLHLRWFMLALLGLVALVEAIPRLRARRIPAGLRSFVWMPVAFIGLCFVSTTWSPQPLLTFERTVTIVMLFGTAAAIALVTGTDLAAQRRLLAGLGSGAGLVAGFGLLMLASGSRSAAQASTSSTPWRYRGFGENPNTIAVLAAVALPIVVWLGLTAPSVRSRTVWMLAFVMLVGSTAATGSRGGLTGALVGVEVVLATMIPRSGRRIAAVAGYALIVLAAVALRQVTQPAPPAFYSAIPAPPPAAAVAPPPAAAVTPKPKSETAPGPSSKPSRPKAQIALKPGKPLLLLPNRADEIGHPFLSRAGVTTIGSGRVAAWIGTLKDVVLQRPLVGYGFGTEERVFVDRWYNFQGGTPENSEIGLLLQLGVVGLLLILGLVARVIWSGVRVLRGGLPEQRSLVAACLGVVASGIALTFFQAYVYSVGNVATLTVWFAVFVLAVQTLGTASTDTSASR